jgi:hypothetical protein
MDLGRNGRLGSLRRPRNIHGHKRDTGGSSCDGLIGDDGVVLQAVCVSNREASYKFMRGDILKPKFERESTKMWLVLENYVSVREVNCVKCIDPVSGDLGYFMEMEMESAENNSKKCANNL